MVLARHAGHAWYARLEPSRLDLGKGKRQLCQGGKLDREYHVTVPEAFLHAD
ncbi:type IV toxin-antitoxin system AbiEi family antitoxin domain-containing protein [Halomonas sp. HMF6819]|uniref:type IV toxin-antitoxin system AbiEi family antitoxin domain-containing protein n=1 Tax=Halomonas sp. HMF6819 TaxID=3373085 RepID=UPI0037A4A74D